MGIFSLPAVVRRRATKALAVLVLGFALFPLGSCGGEHTQGSSSVPGTLPGTYHLMLVGTGSDGLQHNLDLTLVVN